MEDLLPALVQVVYDWIAQDPRNVLFLGLGCSVYSLVTKLALKAPSPNDPTWKKVLWAIVPWTDRFSLNSAPYALLAKKEEGQ